MQAAIQGRAPPIHDMRRAANAKQRNTRQASVFKGKGPRPIHDKRPTKGTRSETNMGKVLVVILATMAALWIAFLVVGPQIGNTAFNMPHFHTAVPWMAVLGACVGYGFYRIVKGK